MTWAKFRKIVMSHEDDTECLEEGSSSRVEDTDTSTVVIPAEVKQKTATEIRRTPMGEYIVPEGKKPLTSLGFICPGPANYFPSMGLIKSSAPNYSIVGKPKKLDGKRHLPGPSEYNCGEDILWKKKTITMKGRNKTYLDLEVNRSFTSPGKYKVEIKSIGTDAPKYKIGTKALEHHAFTRFQTPGPNYRPNSSYWGRGYLMSIGKILKKSEKELTPGPADYDVDTRKRGPSYSFKGKLSDRDLIKKQLSHISPAANTYYIESTIGKAPAISITSRKKDLSESKMGPGPARYFPRRSTFNKNKATALSYKWFEVPELITPGPADYDVKHINLKTIPKYTCRAKTKATYPDSLTYAKVGAVGPGPGAYHIVEALVKSNNPAFSMRKRPKDRTRDENFPGPNVYHVEKCEIPDSIKAPSFSMAKTLLQRKNVEVTPGPGDYNAELKSSAPKYTMSRRPQQKEKFINPAPNSYFLPEIMARKRRGVAFKSRASPYIYSGFKTTKLDDPVTLPQINA